jgi:hypothetical protein
VTALALSYVQQLAACAVCGGSKSDNDWAFGATTVVLSTLPPILFGVMLFIILRFKKRADAAAAVAPPAE